MEDLKTAREEEDVITDMALLQLCLHKNVEGIFSSELYSYLHTGEPKQVAKFCEGSCDCAEVDNHSCRALGAEAYEGAILARAAFSYGSFALCLSGGGMMVSTIWFQTIWIHRAL